jgi:hypothetical protein
MRSFLCGLLIGAVVIGTILIGTATDEATATSAAGPPTVYHAVGTTVTPIDPLPVDAVPLPDTLVIEPGLYSFHGGTYDATQEGVYRFLAPGLENQQRIVYRDDIDAFMSAVAWVYAHGHGDDNKPFNTLVEKAKTGKLLGTCGGLASWVVQLGRQHGITARMVAGLTLDEWNGYDNGHTMIEAWHPGHGKWVVYDLDINAVIERGGVPLNMVEFVDAVPTDDYDIVKVASDTQVDVAKYENPDGYNYGFFLESTYASDEMIRRFYRRDLQVQLMRLNGVWRFHDEANRERVEEYSGFYRYMPYDEFMATFYPPPK